MIGAAGMLCVAAAAVALEYRGYAAVRWLALVIGLGMIGELVGCAYRSSVQKKNNLKNPNGAPRLRFYILPVLWLCLVAASAWYVGRDPWVMLLLLLIVGFADIGAFVFGRLIGGDKMWKSISPNKTWSGQIAGIICGTVIAVAYGFYGTALAVGSIAGAEFMPSLIWIGIAVSILSQYGDLTASWIKRKMGVKDFSNLIPGHGGLLDRFDGWIYALPLMWIILSWGAAQ